MYSTGKRDYFSLNTPNLEGSRNAAAFFAVAMGQKVAVGLGRRAGLS